MKVTASLFLIFLAFSLGIAQERTLSESEFTEIQTKAENFLVGKAYRLTKTKLSFEVRDSEPVATEINLKEIVPPNKWRTVEELKSAEKNTRTERIWDGDFLYKRDERGNWTRLLGGNSGGISIRSGQITKTYKAFESEFLNGEKANIYFVETHRIANKFTQTSSYQVHYVDKAKYWISDSGGFLKVVIESEVVGAKWLIRDTWIYEYDPNLTIEAPINRSGVQ